MSGSANRGNRCREALARLCYRATFTQGGSSSTSMGQLRLPLDFYLSWRSPCFADALLLSKAGLPRTLQVNTIMIVASRRFRSVLFFGLQVATSAGTGVRVRHPAPSTGRKAEFPGL